MPPRGSSALVVYGIFVFWNMQLLKINQLQKVKNFEKQKSDIFCWTSIMIAKINYEVSSKVSFNTVLYSILLGHTYYFYDIREGFCSKYKASPT